MKNVWTVKVEVRYRGASWDEGEVLTYRVLGNCKYQAPAERARRLAIRDGAAAARPVHIERGERVDG